jgi:hypothetical protein
MFAVCPCDRTPFADYNNLRVRRLLQSKDIGGRLSTCWAKFGKYPLTLLRAPRPARPSVAAVAISDFVQRLFNAKNHVEGPLTGVEYLLLALYQGAGATPPGSASRAVSAVDNRKIIRHGKINSA